MSFQEVWGLWEALPPQTKLAFGIGGLFFGSLVLLLIFYHFIED